MVQIDSLQACGVVAGSGSPMPNVVAAVIVPGPATSVTIVIRGVAVTI
jgi:hypothetical protein